MLDEGEDGALGGVDKKAGGVGPGPPGSGVRARPGARYFFWVPGSIARTNCSAKVATTGCPTLRLG